MKKKPFQHPIERRFLQPEPKIAHVAESRRSQKPRMCTMSLACSGQVMRLHSCKYFQ